MSKPSDPASNHAAPEGLHEPADDLNADQLNASEQRFRLLVQGVTDYAIYMLSPEGMVSNWNSGAERIKGYTESEVLNTHFSRFHTQEDQACGLPGKSLVIAAETGRYEKEGWRVRKDGSQFWAHVIIDALYDPDGTVVGFAKITRDITEKKQAEQELERANAALFQSQKLEALGQLTGGVAHDFNNLLSVLASGLDVLTTHAQGHSELKMIQSMRRAIERGAALTQQLLSFARRQPLKAEYYNINSLISSFDPVLRRAIDASISLSIELSSQISAVLIDAARFEAALLNLVVNARDAMPDGGHIRMSTQDTALRAHEVGTLPEGNYVKVTVTDTGTGMPQEAVKRAVEPFFTTKELGKGTGLGLSQVYGFITQSGGDLVINSKAGEGTSICMYLPAVEDDTPIKEAGHSSGDAETVLVVEDEPDVLDVAAELVRSIGYGVVTATNGEEALELLRKQPQINVLFTDVMMPSGINGIELARRAVGLRPELKVLLTSGYPLPVLQSEHGTIDEFSFMNKPYRLAELAQKLRTAH